MALMALDENAPPESYAGLRDARASPLFRSWARDYGGSPGEKINKLGLLLKSRYARTRIGPILELTESQFEAACIDPAVKGEAGWRTTFEYYTDGKFVKPAVPSSAALYTKIMSDQPSAASTEDREDKEERAAKADFGKMNTISKELKSVLDDIYVAPDVTKVVETPNPFVNEIPDPDVKAVTNEWGAWIFGSFGKMNVGAPLRRKNARQIHSKLPRIAKRKCKATERLEARDWDALLMRKAYMLDRPDALVTSGTECAVCVQLG